MRPATLIRAAALMMVTAILSCDRSQPTAPYATLELHHASAGLAVPAVVISQVYGGGGNSGATLKNDFVELFNPGIAPVSLDGWSVQYASATGNFNQVTPLSGSIAAGSYYLVKEAAGTGGTVDLPTPDAVGSIAMSATAGKIALAQATTALGVACPTTNLVDAVSFGTTATNCGAGTTGTLSNPTAALRKNSGCTYTGNLANDFAVGTPAPRNSATAPRSCGGGPPVSVTVTPDAATISVGASQAFAAEARDSAGFVVNAPITWATGDATIATVDASGTATGVALGSTIVTATTDNGHADTSTVTVTPAVIRWIDVSSSSTSFPPGFQTQVFATARTGQNGLVVPATFTFEAVDPTRYTVATVANTGIVTGVAPTSASLKGGVRITATPVDGATPPYTFTSTSIIIETPAPASTSIYGTNDEFGDPTAASGSNPEDLLIVRPQYTLSYNETRGTPNWVSYELDSRQFGTNDRCNCFSADPLLPAAKQILTSDYTNGGFDRGHMTRSADRTAGNTDNAATFYLTNIVPQTADLNQGPWAIFENAIGDSAEAGRAVYVVTGPLYSRSHGLTYLKDEGKVAVPDSTWKVAFIGPTSGGLPFARGAVQTWDDLAGVTVLAVNMPNVAGIRNVAWQTYLTTVDKIEAATGNDILSLLQVAFQTALEAGDHGPHAAFALSGTPNEGTALTFDASATTDPDLGRTDMAHAEVLTYAWSFGDGANGTGVSPSKAFGHEGTYTVNLTVTDWWGWPSEVSHSVTVANVAPVVAAFAGADLLVGETYAAGGSFADPGTETWTATVNYGDGSGTQSLGLVGKTFQLAHQYNAAGTFAVAVRVSDGEAAGQATATVSVLTPLAGIAVLSDAITPLGSGSGGPLGAGELNSLRAKLSAASNSCRKGNTNPCGNQLGAFINELQAMVSSGRVEASVEAPIIAYAERVITSVG